MSERLVFELQAVDRATAPLKAVQAQVARTAANVNKVTSTMKTYSQGVGLANTATQKWAKGALQQAGYQVGDFAVQVANGTSSIQAFGQQAPQLLQIFGPAGAVIGAAVAIIAAFGVVAQKAGKDLSGMGSALGVLQAPLAAIVESVKIVGTAIGSVFGDMSGEIDTAIIAIGLFAGVMAIRAVPALFAATGASTMFAAAMATFRAAVVASALSAGTFSTALTLARASVMTLGAAVTALGAILMRFLPVAVLIGMAKLIEIFLRLKEGAGGFGEAMGLLGDVVKAVWQAMVDSAKMVPPALSGVWSSIKSGFYSMIASMANGWAGLIGALAESLQSLGLEGMASSLFKANESAFATYIEYNRQAVSASEDAASAFAESGNIGSEAWNKVSDAVNKLKDAVAAGTQEVNIFGDASDKAGGAAKKAAEELSQQQKNMKEIASSIRDAFSSAFMSMVDGTKSVKAAFRDMARSIILKLYEVLVVQQLVNSIMGVVGKAFPALAPAISGTAAMGGPVTGNKAYLVGERGPEIVVPSRNSHVIPNNQIGGGGVTVVQNINISTGVQQTVRNEIRTLMPQIADSAKAAVLDAKRRGGGYGSAFA